MIGGAIRKEMKERVDEVLTSGEAWRKSADNLTAELAKLNAAISQGKVDPATLRTLELPIKHLTNNTEKLSKAFMAYIHTLKVAFARFG